MRYEPRHRATPGTARRLRRSMLSTTLATMALTTAAGGTAAFVPTGADARPATHLDPTSPGSFTAPTRLTWDDPVVVPSSPRTQNGPRAVWRAGADRIDDIPDVALVAYQQSAIVLGEASPGCRLRWTLPAAVGRVLTDHGRRGDRRVDDQGNVRPAILGKPLLARGGRRLGDTDAGLLDEDRRFDRPVGPMLLSPADWTVVGVDGDTDGKRNPQDLDDASLAIAVLLCPPGEDLRTTAGKRTALRRINATPGFVRAVLEVNAAYQRQLSSGAEPVEAVPLTTMPTLPQLPPPPAAKPTDRTPRSHPRADSTIDSGRVPVEDNQSPGQAHQGDGPDLPAPAPEPELEPTSAEVTATYDPESLQISATAVVSAGGVTPTGEVTFTLTGPGGVEVVAQVPLAGGSATARFEVTDPGAYTVAASYAGTENHSRSEGNFVVQVTLPPSTEPAADASE